MTDWNPLIIATAAAIPAIAAALIGLINAYRISAVHAQINSRLDQLVTASKAVAMSEGIALGRQQAAQGPVQLPDVDKLDTLS